MYTLCTCYAKMQTLATRCVTEGSFSMKSMDSMHPAKHQIIMKDISQSLSWGRLPQNTGYWRSWLKRVPMAGATGFHPWSASTRQRPRITQSNRLHIDFRLYPPSVFSGWADIETSGFPDTPNPRIWTLPNPVILLIPFAIPVCKR